MTLDSSGNVYLTGDKVYVYVKDNGDANDFMQHLAGLVLAEFDGQQED